MRYTIEKKRTEWEYIQIHRVKNIEWGYIQKRETHRVVTYIERRHIKKKIYLQRKYL